MKTRILISMLLTVFFLNTGCFNKSNFNLLQLPEDTLSARVVKTVGEKDTDNRVLLLDIDGVISGVGERTLLWDEDALTTAVAKKLDKAAQDKRIKAVVLRINSPGGTVTASEIIYREIMEYKSKTRVPVTTIMMDVAASGGYYIACASDKIVAHRSTVTGSIGVIIFSLGFNGLFDKIGMESRVIKSGELKDMGNPFDKFSEEERAAFQNIVDKMYNQFLDVVVASRKMDREKLRVLADGRVYLGEEAKANGLIDEVGYVDDAIMLAMKEARITNAKVLLYTDSRRKELNVYSNNMAVAPKLESPIPDLNAVMDMARPRMMYMWMGQ